jgi:hypothetical protein
MKYIAIKFCELFETTLPPFDAKDVYRSIVDNKLYARCTRCETDGCMITVEEEK